MVPANHPREPRVADDTLSNDALFTEPLQQVAALCWRAGPNLEVLLITSLSTRRWIVPKGWPMEGLSLAQAAAREAAEEAGVIGQADETPLGHYHYMKEKKDGSALPCRVSVFALAVSGQRPHWAEEGARELAWLPLEEAAQRVSEPGLARILREFRADAQPVHRRA